MFRFLYIFFAVHVNNNENNNNGTMENQTFCLFLCPPEVSSVHFDTDSEFYIGGVERAMYGSLPDKVKSREGFQGCVGSLDIDGDSRNILEKHRSNIPQEYQKDIEVGCEGECHVTPGGGGGGGGVKVKIF